MDVTIYGITSGDISRIIWELHHEHDIKVHDDFDFFYHPPQQPKWDNETQKFVPKHVVFSFKSEETGIWFSLKYVR
jgi:hypothetical protein